jgi:hypothetical protein
VDAARRVLAECDVRHPRDIHVEAIAARFGAMTLYGRVATSRAHIVRAGKRAVIRVDETARGTPRARFTVAHELGHHVMHDVVDHFEQCTAEEKREGSAWQIEAEASDFARELVAPAEHAAAYCAKPRPTFEDVERLGRVFKLSMELAVVRFVGLADAAGVACAAAYSSRGVIRWAPETRAFPGKIVRWRALDGASDAARIAAGRGRADGEPREVRGAAWGGTGAFVEQSIRLGAAVLSWIVPA